MAGYGCTKTTADDVSRPISRVVYATHRPSGENVPVVGTPDSHAAKRCGVSVREGERHQRELLPIGYIEQQDAASRRPGGRNVRGALFRRRQPIGGTGAIGRLPVDRGIAIAIGLERHEAAVGGPHGIPIASAECQPPRCSARFQVTHPDAYVAPVVMTECQVAFIRRHARFAVGSGRHLQRLLSARPVERVDREVGDERRRSGPRQVDEGSVGRHGKMGCE